MRTFAIIILFITLSLVNFVYAQNTWLSAPLDKALSEDNADQTYFKVNIILNEKVNLDSLQTVFRTQQTPLDVRAKTTINLLTAKANATQKNIANYLHQHEANNITQLWICNLIIAELKGKDITPLLQFSEIEHIELASEQTVKPIDFTKSTTPAPKSINGREPGLTAIGAPFMWNLGYTGHGRKMYSVDTGCWPQHPAIGNRFLANFLPMEQCWFAYDSPLPADKSNSHGTHILGTTLGLDAANNDTIGSAFKAYWIATDPIVQNPADIKPISELMLAFQFAMNPDGDTATTDDIPDAINNSWGIESNQQADTLCVSFVSDVFIAVEAAGIASIHSAGNNGPGAATIGRPAFISPSLVNVFAVGAVDAEDVNYTVAGFSSRGPSFCGGGGSIEIKPEVSAPGVNVRSCVGQDDYDNYDGTSMASPHVTGAVLLLKEAFPFLPGEELKYALYYSAIDLGDVGEDNTYGMGMINLEAAYNYLSQTWSPVPPQNNTYDIAVSQITSPADGGFTCNENFTPQVIIKNTGDSTLTTASIHYSINGGPESTYAWSGSLVAGQTQSLTLPALQFNGSGNVEFMVRAELNDTINEYDYINNRRISRFNYRQSVTLPFMEDFEDGISPAVWYINNPDYDLTWDTVTSSGLGWESYAAYMPFGSEIINNRLDELISPVFDLSGTDSLTLRFDMSYQHKHPSLSDTVTIYASTNCGASFPYKIWKKGGDTLSTWDDNTNNFIPSLPEHWREEVVNISQFAGENLLLKFVGKNRRGNYFTLDNIWIYNGNKPASIAEETPFEVSVYPNPAGDYVTIETLKSETGNWKLELCDLTGRSVLQTTSNIKHQTLNISNLSSGIYTLHYSSEQGSRYFKLIKR